MQTQETGRHRGATRPSTLRVRGAGGLALPPAGANDFRHRWKCSEYTGPARWPWPGQAPAAIAREICESLKPTREISRPSSKRSWP